MQSDNLNKSAEEYAAFLLDDEAVANYLHQQVEAIVAKAVPKDQAKGLADEITNLCLRAFGMGGTAREIEQIREKDKGAE
jgi:hypothetical protein